jgi:hypothetical protein
MCYLVVERYSVCRCLYYKHPVDMCSAYGQPHHPIQERTVLVGYSCEEHSNYQPQQETSSRAGYSDSGYGTASHGSARPNRGQKSSHLNRMSVLNPPLASRIGVMGFELDDTLRSKDNLARKESDETSMKEDQEGVRLDSEKKSAREEVENQGQTVKSEMGESGMISETPNPTALKYDDGSNALSQIPTHENVNFPPAVQSNEEILHTATGEDSKTADDSTFLYSSRSGFPQVTDDPNHPIYLDSLRSRLVDSEAYFTSLSELERMVWLNSSLSIQKSEISETGSSSEGQRNITSFVPYPEVSNHLLEYDLDLPKPLPDDVIARVCGSEAASEPFRLLLECRNITMRTYLNLRRLQLTGFCGTQFSMIFMDRHRPNVARLLMIDISKIIELLKILESWLQESAKTMPLFLPFELVAALFDSTIPDSFEFWLSSLDFFDELFERGAYKHMFHILHLVWLYVCMLDVGVVSYAGAHLNDIPSQFHPKDAFGIYIKHPNRFLLEREAVEYFSITVRRCSLQCLDEFHDGKAVWIFSHHDWNPSDRLYLSTTVTAFADIWGPLWKAIDQKESNKYAAYIVGNGSILPWKHNQTRDPALKEYELFCHWVSDEMLDADVDPLLFSDKDHRSFDGSEDLLIGAPTPEIVALNISFGCQLSISKARQRLRDMGRLCILGAARQYTYSDESQYQLQIGYSGVNASATKQYKRNAGQTLKKVLVELWTMEPGLRDPRILKDLHGVEVSLCTHNAQRVSLAYLLGLNCMRSLLADFNWKNEQYKTEHFETLKDTSRQFRQSEVAFREQFEHAVMLCLKMLSKTGVDRKKNFSVFLSSTCTPKPEIATLVATEHSWIGLLKDTTTDCAMAAFGDQCLEFKHKETARCGGSGRSAFLTAIVPNELAESLPITKFRPVGNPESASWVWHWSVENLREGQGFWLAERGTLRLRGHLEDGGLVVEWGSWALKSSMKFFAGKEYPHREYTEVDQSGEESVRPIPVLIISDRARDVG